MKVLLFLFVTSLFATSAHAILLAEEPAGHCRDAYRAQTRDMCKIFSFTTFPVTILIQDEAELNNDDVMIQLSDEVNGMSESTVTIDKMAKHFEVTAEEVVETTKAVENSEEGLSFESLSEALK